MAKVTFITTTNTDGWQRQCIKWAKDGTAFKIHGCDKKHLLFFHELCAAYKYRVKISRDGAAAHFTPADSK